MTVAEVKKVLDDLPDEYDIPVMSWLFGENDGPYLVSEDFHRFMQRLNKEELDIKDILWEMEVLGDTQDNIGSNFCNNLWKVIEALQDSVK